METCITCGKPATKVCLAYPKFPVFNCSEHEHKSCNFGFNIGHAGDLMHEEKYEHVACVEGEKLRELCKRVALTKDVTGK